MFAGLRQRVEVEAVREARFRRTDGGVLRRLSFSLRYLQDARGLLLRGDGWCLGVLRPPQLPWAPVPPRAGRVPAAQRLGGVLAWCRLLPQDHRVLIAGHNQKVMHIAVNKCEAN